MSNSRLLFSYTSLLGCSSCICTSEGYLLGSILALYAKKIIEKNVIVYLQHPQCTGWQNLNARKHCQMKENEYGKKKKKQFPKCPNQPIKNYLYFARSHQSVIFEGFINTSPLRLCER